MGAGASLENLSAPEILSPESAKERLDLYDLLVTLPASSTHNDALLAITKSNTYSDYDLPKLVSICSALSVPTSSASVFPLDLFLTNLTKQNLASPPVPPSLPEWASTPSWPTTPLTKLLHLPDDPTNLDTPLSLTLKSGRKVLSLYMITKLTEEESHNLFESIEGPPSLLAVLASNLPPFSAHNWAKSGDINSLKKFNSSKRDYNWTENDAFDSPPLYYACHSGACVGSVVLVDYLLGMAEYGKDVIDRCDVNAISDDVKVLLRGGEVRGKEGEGGAGNDIEEGVEDMGLANLFGGEEDAGGGDY
ncbi:hypothetical protein TrST_g4897 [Triparma strigata]|uniref:Uncharacterized protein n=1 Tax=Triparma strigata TaxID=1606541 RepID=A0A9W7AJT7_9STRA|nr:hypothetical protein TrST_g4897 [Triparma strigata]